MRNLDVAIVSDVHLGTYGSHAEEFTKYLESINPKILILNGDIIDMWQFKKKYFPVSHKRALQVILDKVNQGVEVHYLTGNHDDQLRKYSDVSLGNFHLADKLVLNLDGKDHWIFHGDVFDGSINHSKWIAKFGGKAYDMLIRINRFVNIVRTKMNLSPISVSKKIKANVKKAVKFIGDFEETAIELGIENQYDFVICGHIHQPKIKEIKQGKHKLTYMNSGDWVESLTALEYVDQTWSIFDYNENEIIKGINKAMPVIHAQQELVLG